MGSGEAGVEGGMNTVRALHARGRLGKVIHVSSSKGSRSRRGVSAWGCDWRRANDDSFLAGSTCEFRD